MYIEKGSDSVSRTVSVIQPAFPKTVPCIWINSRTLQWIDNKWERWFVISPWLRKYFIENWIIFLNHNGHWLYLLFCLEKQLLLMLYGLSAHGWNISITKKQQHWSFPPRPVFCGKQTSARICYMSNIICYTRAHSVDSYYFFTCV